MRIRVLFVFSLAFASRRLLALSLSLFRAIGGRLQQAHNLFADLDGPKTRAIVPHDAISCPVAPLHDLKKVLRWKAAGTLAERPSALQSCRRDN